MAASHKCRPSIAEIPPNPPDLNLQVFTASLAKRPKQVDVVVQPVLRVTKIPVGEMVGFDDVLHDLLCLCEDVTRREEPQSPDVDAGSLCQRNPPGHASHRI
jgi:hypothetical protein